MKIDIRDNTVSAKNQMVNSSRVYCLGKPEAKTRILIVGNSITRHGPNEKIGWPRDWGMAASAPEKDYVHRLFTMLVEDGKDVFVRVSQCAEWEMNLLKEGILSNYEDDRNFDADILIFRLGENVPGCNKPYFREKMQSFIEYVCPNGKVIFTTCFWANEIVDDAIRDIAACRDEICIDTCFSSDEENMALGQFEHSGVAMHPGDAGMEKIAEAMFRVLKESDFGL